MPSPDSISREGGGQLERLVNRRGVLLITGTVAVAIASLAVLGLVVYGRLVYASPGALLTVRVILLLGSVFMVYVVFVRQSIPRWVTLVPDGLVVKYFRGHRRYTVDGMGSCEVVLDPVGGAVLLRQWGSVVTVLSAVDESIALRIAHHLRLLGVEVLPTRYVLGRAKRVLREV